MTSNEDQPTKRRKRLDRSQAEREEESVEQRSIASRDLLEIEHKDDTHIPDCCFLDESTRKLKTFPVGKSNLLEKLSEFIPKLKRANDGQQDVNGDTNI